MRSFLLALGLLLPGFAWAFVAVETDQSQPYEVVPVESPSGEERYFLGELADYPIMYEVTADEPFTFTAQLRQLSNKTQQPFALLLIRQNDRGGGVEEVTRVNVPPAEWTRERDSLLGLSFAYSPSIDTEVGPGTYRLEVSSPDNLGLFMLQVGDQPTEIGYWDTLSAVRQTQQWFGYGVLMMLGSRLVYLPLLGFLVLSAAYKVWQYRRTATDHNQSNHATS